MRIYKFNLYRTDLQSVPMPEGAKILSADLQRRDICIWAEVNPDAPIVPRKIRIIGTGNPTVDENRKFIATVLDAPFVWHIYEVQE